MFALPPSPASKASPHDPRHRTRPLFSDYRLRKPWTLDRIKSKAVIEESGCWVKRRMVSNRYSSFALFGKCQLAHRVSWQVVNGPIPDGFCVCHRCNNKRCFNPEHLYLGTHAENMRDAGKDGLMSCPREPRSVTLVNAMKTHCIHGHEFSLENTRFTLDNKRRCRPCSREHSQRARDRQKRIVHLKNATPTPEFRPRAGKEL